MPTIYIPAATEATVVTSESPLLRIIKPNRINSIAATIISSWYRGNSYRLRQKRRSRSGINNSGNSRNVLSTDNRADGHHNRPLPTHRLFKPKQRSLTGAMPTPCNDAAEARLAGGEEKVAHNKRKSPPPPSSAADGTVESLPNKKPSFSMNSTYYYGKPGHLIMPAANHYVGATNMHEAKAKNIYYSTGGIGERQLHVPIIESCWAHSTPITPVPSYQAYLNRMIQSQMIMLPNPHKKVLPNTHLKQENKETPLGKFFMEHDERNAINKIHKIQQQKFPLPTQTTQKKPNVTVNTNNGGRDNSPNFHDVADRKSPPSDPITQARINRFDVISGRGSGPYDQPGNVNFRVVVASRKAEYLALGSRECQGKNMIAKEVIDVIRAQGGRFMRKVKGAADEFELVEEHVAMEKAKQALRQKRMDYISNVMNDGTMAPNESQEDELVANNKTPLGNLFMEQGKRNASATDNRRDQLPPYSQIISGEWRIYPQPPKSQNLNGVIVAQPPAAQPPAVASRPPETGKRTRITTPEEREALDALLKCKESPGSLQKHST